MQKMLINLFLVLFIFWIQEGLLTSLNLYLPLLVCVIALFHLYRLPSRWLVTIVMGVFIEITSLGFSGQLLGLLAVGLMCQLLYSFVSHAHDQFYVVIVGPLTILVGEVVSRLSVNFITNKLIGTEFIMQPWSLMYLLKIFVSSMVILFIGKLLLQKNYRYA